jgi:hypothetical protein
MCPETRTVAAAPVLDVGGVGVVGEELALQADSAAAEKIAVKSRTPSRYADIRKQSS